jgi:hypothetical protein
MHVYVNIQCIFLYMQYKVVNCDICKCHDFNLKIEQGVTLYSSCILQIATNNVVGGAHILFQCQLCFNDYTTIIGQDAHM